MPRKKVALLFVCVNSHYWTYLRDVIKDCKTKFLPDHQVDFFVWSDIPELNSKEYADTLKKFPTEQELEEAVGKEATLGAVKSVWEATMAAQMGADKGAGPAWMRALQRVAQKSVDAWSSVISESKNGDTPIASSLHSREEIRAIIDDIRGMNITMSPTEGAQWPMPTLMRYHLFLQQEDKLKDYDYLFYLDADMRVVDTVGNEILGSGLTMAEHPMYALRKEYVPPYEPNSQSSAYIPRLGCVLEENGKKWFRPLYAAGGFQGGTSASFIEAMNRMKEAIDSDFAKNYVAIWNDESHWNKYLYGYKGHLTVLTPSYVYPDSLIDQYYKKVWGRDYVPKIITLTKPFTASKGNADDLQKKLASM